MGVDSEKSNSWDLIIPILDQMGSVLQLITLLMTSKGPSFMLSDEEMSFLGWQFSLLNDEKMSNKRVENQPVKNFAVGYSDIPVLPFKL